jgi:hypothetical protein
MSDAVRAGSNVTSTGTLALAVLGAQQFVATYDAVSMNVAIQQLVAGLDTTPTGVQPGNALVMVFMVTGAKLADRWGRVALSQSHSTTILQ